MVGRQLVGRGVALGAIGMLSVVIGGIGVATAANGGSLVLGHSNTATSTTTLSNSKGTPLALKARHGKAPLKVNSSTKVRHLNADKLDGSSAAALATSGAGVSTNYPDGDRGIVTIKLTKVTQTRPLAKGTYFVSASVSATLPDADFLTCLVTASAPTSRDEDDAAFATGGAVSLPETEVIAVKAGQRITQYCELEPSGPPAVTDTAEVSQAGLTAIRVAHAKSGTVLKSIPVA
jgi:hypothetical protein